MTPQDVRELPYLEEEVASPVSIRLTNEIVQEDLESH